MSTANANKLSPPTKLLWVDLEMTGLDVQSDRIIELACIVTDMDFKVLDTYEAVISQTKDVMDGMSEWCVVNHGESGLTERVLQHGIEERLVVSEFCEFITKHFDGQPAVLAGNSISNDRNFIKQWWPQVDALLHYRMLDVSSWKIIMNSRGIEFPKQKAHRALDDIEKSIEELQCYMEHFKNG